MSIESKKALPSGWVHVEASQFTIEEDMDLKFRGQSCYIENQDKNEVAKYNSDDGEVNTTILAGCQCYVMKAMVEFTK